MQRTHRISNKKETAGTIRGISVCGIRSNSVSSIATGPEEGDLMSTPHALLIAASDKTEKQCNYITATADVPPLPHASLVRVV